MVIACGCASPVRSSRPSRTPLELVQVARLVDEPRRGFRFEGARADQRIIGRSVEVGSVVSPGGTGANDPVAYPVRRRGHHRRVSSGGISRNGNSLVVRIVIVPCLAHACVEQVLVVPVDVVVAVEVAALRHTEVEREAA
jgi:hypothetical protein